VNTSYPLSKRIRRSIHSRSHDVFDEQVVAASTICRNAAMKPLKEGLYEAPNREIRRYRFALGEHFSSNQMAIE